MRVTPVEVSTQCLQIFWISFRSKRFFTTVSFGKWILIYTILFLILVKIEKSQHREKHKITKNVMFHLCLISCSFFSSFLLSFISSIFQIYAQEFLYRYKYGMLQRGALFSVYYKEHRDEVLSLFRLFYSAKDFQTFYKVACWARYYMNEGLFITALTTAIMYRPDTMYIQLPPFYEVYPNYFFDAEIIQEAHHIKMMSGKSKNFFQSSESHLIEKEKNL